MKLAMWFGLWLGCLMATGQTEGGWRISGPDNVCVRECYVYTFTDADGKPDIPEGWQVRDGIGNNISFQLLDDSTAILICFGSTTAFTISAIIPGGLITRTVTPGTFTDLPVIVEIDGCKNYRPQDCIEVCEGMRFRVRVENLVPEELQWQEFGLRGMKIIAQNKQFVYLEANVDPGQYELVYFGYTQSQCFFEGNICIKVIPPAKAAFEANYPISMDTVQLCLNQALRLKNTSQARFNQWILPDGKVNNGQILLQSFTSPGIYTLTQQVSNFECLCNDQKELHVLVLDASGPNITCTGTVCQGDTATYETESECIPYYWQLSANGIIVAGGGPEDDFIRVHWPQGNTGTVSMTNGCHPTCPVPDITDIPILGKDNRITGPNRVCLGETYIFNTDNLGGTNFRWEILPSGTILEGQGSARMLAQFSLGAPQRRVVLHYENCHLECSGTDTLEVNIAQRFAIEGDTRLCNGENTTWTARNTQWPNTPVLAQWEVLDLQGNSIYQYPQQSTTFDWPLQIGVGSFTVVAKQVTADFCQQDARQLIHVFQTPDITAHIEGPDQICPQTLVTYTLNQQQPNLTYVWEITQSGQTTIQAEYPLRIVLDGSESMRIAVKAIDPISGCSSGLAELFPSVLDTLQIQIDGTDCLFGESTFTVLGEQLGKVTWEVGDPNIANRLDFPSAQSVRFKWIQPGTVSINASYCGLTNNINYTVNNYFEPVVSHPIYVCQGQQASVEAQGDWQSYLWYRGDELVCTTADCMLTPGRYRLDAVDSAGCQGRAVFEIENRTLPNIQIFAPAGTGFCQGDSVILVSTRINDPLFTYSWIRNGADITDSSDTLVIRDFETYQRRITDISTGCSYTTSPISFCEFCDPGLVCFGCPCSPIDTRSPSDPKVIATINPTARCHSFDFKILTPDIVSGSVLWIIKSPSGGVFSGTEESFTQRFNEVGYYLVTLFAEYIDDMGIQRKPSPSIFNFEVSAIADFEYSRACLNEPTEFESLITVLGSTQVQGYQWSFGDPAMGSSILPNTQYLFAASGNYAVTLRIDTDKGCFVDTMQWINIVQPAAVQWSFDSHICIDQALQVDLNTQKVIDIQWYFDLDNYPNAIMDISAPGRHGYTLPGIYRFGVLVLDTMGCRSFRSDQVTVNALPDPGTISADKFFPVCQGDTVTLESTLPGLTYNWSTGESSQQIKVAQSGRYELTITDGQGCSSAAEPIQASYYPLPDSGVMLQGTQKLIFSPDTLMICAGETISLQALALPHLVSYHWSTGDTTQTILYDDIQYPRLNPGDYSFTLTVTDRTTGCTSVNTQIYIRVYSLPDKPEISGDQPKPWCSPNAVTLQVDNSAMGITYTWNTGEEQASITIQSPGNYWVTATNEFGCRSESTRLEMYGPPAMNFLPEGCYIVCEADTLCLPPPNGYQITEWLFNDLPLLPQPENLQAPVLTQSGNYAASLVTQEGCTYTSPAFSYDIVPGKGTLGGILFEDTNMDGMYQPGEPLIQGVKIYLEGNNVQDSTVSGLPGTYYFRPLPLGNYQVRVDTLSLPTGYYVEIDELNINIQYCDELLAGLFFPVKSCQSDTSTTTIKGCFGEKIILGNIEWVLEKDTIISIVTPEGPCRDVAIYELNIYPIQPPVTELFNPCTGDFVDIMGIRVERDTILSDTLADANGCDSILLFDIRFRPLEQTSVELLRCPDGEVWFRNIRIDRDTSFVFRASGSGPDCDTLYHIGTAPYDLQIPTLNILPSCPGKDDGALQITSNTSGNVILDGIDYGNNRFIRPIPTGAFELIWTDSNQCRQTFELTMLERDSLQGIIAEKVISCGEEITLQIEVQSDEDSTFQALWQNGQMGLTLSVNRPGIYLAEIRNACESKIIRGLVSDRDDGRTQLYFVPSAFTPNEDGINEGFKTYWPDDVVVEKFLLEVYDRWGQLQFRSSDPEAEWTGFRKDQQEKVAVYIWKLNASVEYCGEKKVIKDSGDVTLIR